MKVYELIEKLQTMNQELDVHIPHDDGEYKYYIVNSVIEQLNKGWDIEC